MPTPPQSIDFERPQFVKLVYTVTILLVGSVNRQAVYRIDWIVAQRATPVSGTWRWRHPAGWSKQGQSLPDKELASRYYSISSFVSATYFTVKLAVKQSFQLSVVWFLWCEPFPTIQIPSSALDCLPCRRAKLRPQLCIWQSLVFTLNSFANVFIYFFNLVVSILLLDIL